MKVIRAFWFACLASLVSFALACGFAYFSGDLVDRHAKVMGFYLASVASWALFLGWIVIWSGWSLLKKLAGATAYVAAFPLVTLAIVRQWHFDGDLRPVVTFRWQNETNRDVPDDVVDGLRVSIVQVPDDFPNYRGKDLAGVVTGPQLNRDWVKNPPTLLWRRAAGEGYAGFSVVGDAAFTLDQDHGDEVVLCLQASTGKKIWSQRYPSRFSEPLGGDGPRTTPTFSDGLVYSLGANGQLCCFEAESGTKRWNVNVLDNNRNIPWGMSGSPLVAENLVIVNPGLQLDSAAGHAVQAFDRRSGALKWASGYTKAGYASPMIATLGNVRQVLVFDGVELAGYESVHGNKLWHHPWPTYQDINVAQPLVLSNDRVFISSGYGVGSALLGIQNENNQWTVSQLWRDKKNLRCKFSSPVEHQGYIFGLDDGILVCIEAATGQRKWKGERFGHGQMLRQDDLLVIFSETGKLALVEANHRKYIEVTSMQVFDELKNWNPFALARGMVYLRNHREMACYDLRDKK